MIKKRFDTFENQSMAVIQELQDQGRYVRIDSSRSEEEVSMDIHTCLKETIPLLFEATYIEVL